jgi:hypothetical protein
MYHFYSLFKATDSKILTHVNLSTPNQGSEYTVAILANATDILTFATKKIHCV